MGKPAWSHVQVLPAEYIGRVEGTTGSETSQYRQEKIFREYWREKADQAKPYACDTRQGLRVRGCGTIWLILPCQHTVKSMRVGEALGKGRRRG
jgi:hypothetical protein